MTIPTFLKPLIVVNFGRRGAVFVLIATFKLPKGASESPHENGGLGFFFTTTHKLMEITILWSFVQVQLLFDATFSIVPAPFKQCLIAMVFNAALKIYVPVAWILMTGKSDECYWQAFNWLTNSVECIDPSYIGVDFELAFFRMIDIHFPDAKLLGCKFHFKQAARRMMVKLGISENEVKFAMKSGVYDLVMVLEADQIQKGIAYVRTKIIGFVEEQLYSAKQETTAFEKWDQFWEFFERFWMQDEFFKVCWLQWIFYCVIQIFLNPVPSFAQVWNVSKLQTDDAPVQFLTNNALRIITGISTILFQTATPILLYSLVLFSMRQHKSPSACKM